MAVCLQYLECVPKSIEGIDIWGGRRRHVVIRVGFGTRFSSSLILLLPGLLLLFNNNVHVNNDV